MSEQKRPAPANARRGRATLQSPAKATARSASRRRALLVLGMHRSGTSALARVLSLRGASLPETVLPPNRGNPTGYWEPEAIVALNDRMLEYFGVEWDNPFAALQLPPVEAYPARFREEAKRILSSEYAGADLFVLKDPRCTLLHAFWREALEESGANVVPLVIMRPYAEVAESLVRRDGTSATGAALLYIAYGLEAARVVDAGAGVITYAQLLDDWRSATDRIAERHDFTWPRSGARAAGEIDAFLRAPTPVSARNPHLPEMLADWTARIWQWFESAAQGQPSPASTLDSIRNDLQLAMGVFAPLLADRAARLQELAQQVAAASREAKDVAALLDASQATLARTAAERDTALAERDQLLEARVQDETAAHRAKWSETERERLAALEQRDQALAELHRSNEAGGVRERQLAQVVEDRDGLQAELTRVRQHASQLEQSLEEQRSLIALRDRELAAATAEAATVRQALEAERSRLEGELERTQAAYRQLETQGNAERDAARSERDQARKQVASVDQQRLAAAATASTVQQHAVRAQARVVELEEAQRVAAQARAQLEAEIGEVQAQLAQTQSEATQARAQLEAEIAEVQAQLARTAAEISTLRGDRERLAELHKEAHAELVRTQELYRQLDHEATVLRAGLVERERQLEAAAHDHRKRESSLLTSLELSRNGLAAAREELEVAQETIARIDRQRDAFQRELDIVTGSRSWRITAPLRDAARLGRKLVTRPPTRLLLPAPALAAPAPAVAPMLSAPQPVAAERVAPAFDERTHASLRAYLVEEFGTQAADEVVKRIDRYRLPIPGDEVRTAHEALVDEADALAWAAAIARRASHRIDPEVEPEVSIVVPVFGQVAFTLACIDALVAHRTGHAFEILIGDDASPDATAAALSIPINGVHHVRHPDNLGFVRNCNATAAHARGRYVVFLNNDTQVLPGWLDELVGTLQQDSGIGLAGSKLVYPDGRLQECGGIVWRDGSAWNFGRLDDPRRPEYSYLRDADFVSGASIALSRALWQELGGFDELFVPAYAEDVDLAFRVRARGLRTVVQPLSQLLHFEGISSGTDLGHGAKAYQVENLRKLHARWQEVLAGHRANAERPDLEKERGIARRMLFVDLVTPTPNEDAGSLVVREMMTAFRGCGFKITFIPEDNFAHMGATTHDLQRVGIEAIYHPAYSSLPAFLAARQDAFDVIVLVRFRVGEAHLRALRQAYPAARIIFSNCDLHYLREMREAELSGDAGAIAAAQETKRREIEVIAGADLNLVHSEAELELLAKDAPAAPTVLFPLVHDPVLHCPPLEGRSGTCFVGSYRHPPNADGIRWFVEKIWPLVRQRLPGETLYIAGSGVSQDVLDLAQHANVEVVGFVEDLESFLAQRRAAIAPLRFGAGAKGKVAVSLASGVPVVSTFVGVEGMQLAAGVEVLVADDEADFAASLIEVLSSDRLWHQLSAAGMAYAARVTSRGAALGRARDICTRLGAR